MRALALLVCVLASGCGEDGGDCPESGPVEFFQSGTFTAQEGLPVDYTCESGCSAVFPPHEGVGPLTMKISLETETVTVAYMRGGKAIRETWRIKDRVSR